VRKKTNKQNLLTESIKMKKRNLCITLILSPCFLMTSAFAATGVDPTGSTPAPAAQETKSFSSCSQADFWIQRNCTGSTSYAEYQAKSSQWKAFSAGGRDAGAKAQLVTAKTEISSALVSIEEMKRVCTEATNSCISVCGRQYEQAASNNNTTAMNQANTTANKCSEEQKKMIAKSDAAQMDLEQILKTVMAALQMLQGMGGDGSKAALTTDEDPCEGQYKDILVECNGQSDPKGTRASLNGTGVSSNNGTNADGLLQSASQGEAGGTSKGNNLKASGMGASGSGMGGFGGGMSNGMGSSGSASAGDGEKGLDTDIQKGFMSADGGGSGGGGGGSSGSPASPFGKFGLASAGEAVTKSSALQKKLSDLVSSEKRGLASSGDTNGPFQDNWDVIKKAYKNNTQSMFHQK
jgi:hypothetical protein